MTTPSFSATANYTTSDLSDHGVSDTARDLRDILVHATAFEGSITFAQRREEAEEALLDTYCHAIDEDWDGTGAVPADPLSYEYTQSVLETLPSWAPNPDIYVDPDGEFCLEWDYGPRMVFSVSVGRDGTLTYAGLFGSRKSHGVEQFIDSLPLIIIQNLERTIPPRSC